MKLLFDNEGFTDEIKRGVIFSLVSSNRPTHELLNPRLQDQRTAFIHQFDGMSAVPFSYDDYEQIRNTLICTLNQSLTLADKEFLLSINRGEPDWKNHGFSCFPSVQWKLLNINTFKTDNPDKHQLHYERLTEQFDK